MDENGQYTCTIIDDQNWQLWKGPFKSSVNNNPVFKKNLFYSDFTVLKLDTDIQNWGTKQFVFKGFPFKLIKWQRKISTKPHLDF